MAKHRDSNAGVAPEGREEFVTANAIALLAERDAKIERLRDAIRRLHQGINSRKQAIEKQREMLKRIAETYYNCESNDHGCALPVMKRLAKKGLS